MNITKPLATLTAVAVLLAGSALLAAPVSVSAVMDPQEQMRFDLGDGSKHFVLAVRREGVASGTGVLDGAAVTEFGWHDIDPPHGGDPRGYLRFETGAGDVAVLKFTVRAVFLSGAETPVLHDNGFWEMTGGTGMFAGKTGVGALVIKPAGGPKREFILTGEIGAAP